MSDEVFNPHAYLARVLRAQLRLEQSMPVEHRIKTMWSAMVEFAGTRVTIGRGGANTCFFTFGDGERKLDYPAKLLKRLDAYARQPYPLYRIMDSRVVIRAVFDLNRARKISPKAGWKLVGVDVDSNSTTCFIARRSVRGEIDWIARGAAK